MPTTVLKTHLDYDDYAAIPNDGKRYELLDGRIQVTPAPNPYHQRASKRFQRQLEAYFETSGRGEVFNAPIDVILTPHDVVQPGLVVVTDARQISRRGIEGPPHLMVEVLSPSTADYDRHAKAQRCAALGVPHFWLLDERRRRLECFRLRSGGYEAVRTFGTDEEVTLADFPGLTIDLSAIWR